MVAGKLLVLPMRPGDGTVNILLVGSMMGGRSAAGVWAMMAGASRNMHQEQMRKRVTVASAKFGNEGENERKARRGGWSKDLQTQPIAKSAHAQRLSS
jgi:hypothetical protein